MMEVNYVEFPENVNRLIQLAFRRLNQLCWQFQKSLRKFVLCESPPNSGACSAKKAPEFGGDESSNEYN